MLVTESLSSSITWFLGARRDGVCILWVWFWVGSGIMTTSEAPSRLSQMRLCVYYDEVTVPGMVSINYGLSGIPPAPTQWRRVRLGQVQCRGLCHSRSLYLGFQKVPPDSSTWSGGLGFGNTSCRGALNRSARVTAGTRRGKGVNFSVTCVLIHYPLPCDRDRGALNFLTWWRNTAAGCHAAKLTWSTHWDWTVLPRGCSKQCQGTASLSQD